MKLTNMILFTKSQDENIVDKYTMYVAYKNQYDVYSFSEDPFHPYGVNLFSHTVQKKLSLKEIAIMDRIDWDDLPQQVQKAIINRLYPESYD